MKYKLRLHVAEEMLASSPADPEVYKEYIASKKKDDASLVEASERTADEVATLATSDEKMEERGWSVFHKDEKGLFLYEYVFKGFLKAAAEAITGTKGLSAYKHKISKWLFISPRKVYLTRENGDFVVKPDGVLERPVRAMTMQGPRVSLKRSDLVRDIYLDFEVQVLPLGESELTEKAIRSWFDYGALAGLCDWRGGGYGRFTYELTKVE